VGEKGRRMVNRPRSKVHLAKRGKDVTIPFAARFSGKGASHPVIPKSGEKASENCGCMQKKRKKSETFC